MVETFTALAFIYAVGVHLVGEATCHWVASRWKSIGITNHDLQRALRDAYDDALSSIEFGFRQRGGLLGLIGKRSLHQEITSSFNEEFLAPFVSEKKLSEEELVSLARDSAKYCKTLRTAVDQVLPKEQILGTTIEDLLLTGRTLEGAEDLRKLNESAKADLMTRVREVKGVPGLFFDFLEYKDLFTWTIVFFFSEKVKADERVRSILTHAELQRIRQEQDQQHQKQAARFEAALQSQLASFQQCFSPIRDNLSEVLTSLERLETEFAETTKYLERIVSLVVQDRVLSDKERKQLQAGLSPTFDLHTRYDFDERKALGYGAVAVVYRAWHKGLRQERAVKLLRPEYKDNEEIVERFLREAVVLGGLRHPNIIQVYDAGGGGPNLEFYLEMEFVEGVTLRNFIKTHEFDRERNLKFIRQLGSAIQKMHESGVIHRDLNSGNIMVDRNGDLKVMDFGVAKIVGVEGLTRDGEVVGTIDYMAPEQARGERVNERADIYSFGVILYEMCTRRLPSVPPLPLRQYEPAVPEQLESVVARCLEPNRERRYASIKEVLSALEGEERHVVAPMRCAFHPERDPTAVCTNCGKLICNECKTVVGQKIYCNPCVNKMFVSGRTPPEKVTEKVTYNTALRWISGVVGVLFILGAITGLSYFAESGLVSELVVDIVSIILAIALLLMAFVPQWVSAKLKIKLEKRSVFITALVVLVIVFIIVSAFGPEPPGGWWNYGTS